MDVGDDGTSIHDILMNVGNYGGSVDQVVAHGGYDSVCVHNVLAGFGNYHVCGYCKFRLRTDP